MSFCVHTVYSLLVSKSLSLLGLIPVNDQAVSESQSSSGVSSPAKSASSLKVENFVVAHFSSQL